MRCASCSVAVAVTALVIGACGDRIVRRPIALDVEGLSEKAQSVVVAIFPSEEGASCGAVRLDTVASLAPPIRVEWSRASNTERRIVIPAIDAPSATLIIYSIDAGGHPIQLACVDVAFADLESPELSVRFAARTAHRMPACRRNSDPSSSSDCSAAAAWPRSSSQRETKTLRESRSS